MIAWFLFVGLLLLLIFLPAFVVGWIAGAIVDRLTRDRKPPLPPPIR